jgi:hypothetical protein
MIRRRAMLSRGKKPAAVVIALASALVVLLASAATATASDPEITRFSFEDSYIDTYTCPGLSLDTSLEGHVVFQMLSQTQVQVHQRLIFTVTANGKTFTDNESFTNFTDLTSGVQTFAGTALNIQVPGYGNVLTDAGVLIFDPTTEPWTVLHVGGHHPLFYEGYGALCDYLAS